MEKPPRTASKVILGQEINNIMEDRIKKFPFMELCFAHAAF